MTEPYASHDASAIEPQNTVRIAELGVGACKTSAPGCRSTSYELGWPGPYICTVYDRMFGDFPAKNTVYTPHLYMFLAIPSYEQAFKKQRELRFVKDGLTS